MWKYKTAIGETLLLPQQIRVAASDASRKCIFDDNYKRIWEEKCDKTENGYSAW